MVQSGDMRWDGGYNRDLYTMHCAYLMGRAGLVRPSLFSPWQEPQNQFFGSKVDGSSFRWYQRSLVPTAASMVGMGGYYLGRTTELSPATRLRVLRRAHEAVPDEPNVKRAPAEAEWRTAKDYEKALRPVCGLEHGFLRRPRVCVRRMNGPTKGPF